MGAEIIINKEVRELYIHETFSGDKELFEKFAKMQADREEDHGASCLFSSHPDHARRIKLLETGTGCR